MGEASELGIPTLIEVRAKPFGGEVRDDTVYDYGAFLQQMELLYDRLVGTASLGSYEGFSLSLVGGGDGGIEVSSVVLGERIPANLSRNATSGSMLAVRCHRQRRNPAPPF